MVLSSRTQTPFCLRKNLAQSSCHSQLKRRQHREVEEDTGLAANASQEILTVFPEPLEPLMLVAERQENNLISQGPVKCNFPRQSQRLDTSFFL